MKYNKLNEAIKRYLEGRNVPDLDKQTSSKIMAIVRYISDGNRQIRNKKSRDWFFKMYGIKPSDIATKKVLDEPKKHATKITTQGVRLVKDTEHLSFKSHPVNRVYRAPIAKKYRPKHFLNLSGQMKLLHHTEDIRTGEHSRFQRDADRLIKPIKKIWIEANDVLYSMTPGIDIEKYTGVNHTTIARLRNRHMNGGRNGNRHKKGLYGIELASIKTLLLLADYKHNRANGIAIKSRRRLSALKRRYLIASAELHFGFDAKKIKSIISSVLLSANNKSGLARNMQLGRQKVTKMANYGYSLMSLHAFVISQFIKEYHHMLSLDEIIPENGQKDKLENIMKKRRAAEK